MFCPNSLKDDEYYNPDLRILNLFKREAKYRVLNYLKEKIDEIFQSNIYHNKTSVLMGLSQESYNSNFDDENESLFDAVVMCPDPNLFVHKSKKKYM